MAKMAGIFDDTSNIPHDSTLKLLQNDERRHQPCYQLVLTFNLLSDVQFKYDQTLSFKSHHSHRLNMDQRAECQQ